ncbi:S-adenosylmethionine synthetase N-terminal domain-containing protein [Chloroflexota bacterium]
MSMYPKNMVFASESVTEGHPDKFCDQTSDALPDECLTIDPLSHVACECCVTVGLRAAGGEVTTRALFDMAQSARDIGNGTSGWRPPSICGIIPLNRFYPTHQRQAAWECLHRLGPEGGYGSTIRSGFVRLSGSILD